ncbi:NAD(P)-binding domain-containing protein [Caldithrix abyssi]|nr:NAD(P)-binding domain-containing protein [Caldithrix abyssi]
MIDNDIQDNISTTSNAEKPCCEQPTDGSACCTHTDTDNGETCCDQPADGSACCSTASNAELVETDSYVQPILASANVAAKKVELPVAIIGGGPIGLAAAAHLHSRGERFILFESGEIIGANIWSWRHVRIFSPWRYNVDKTAVSLLENHGWQSPPLDELPTGGKLVEQYLRPLANIPEFKPHIHLNSRVISVGRKGLDKMKTAGRENLPFVIHVEQTEQIKQFEVRAVIDASGTWANPNPLGSGGVPAAGEEAAKAHILYGIPDVMGEYKARYADRKVLVVGSGHSSINALLDLTRLKTEYPSTEIVWALRQKQMQTVYGGEANDALPARGALGTKIRGLVQAKKIQVFTPFYIHKIEPVGDRLNVIGIMDKQKTTVSGVDEIITSTGARPDVSFLREVRVSFDPAVESVPELTPLIDPNIHSCSTVRAHGEKELRQPEKDFYIVGMKSYGRAPTFLLATGYEQVRSVAAALVGDWEAAAKVELNLPETGVCSSNLLAGDDELASACCGSETPIVETAPAVTVASSCCGPTEPVAVAQAASSCC